jgi:hypothetical protein
MHFLKNILFFVLKGHLPRETSFRYTIAAARNLRRPLLALAIFEDALLSNNVRATSTLNTLMAAIAKDQPMEVLYEMIDKAAKKSIKPDVTTLQEVLYVRPRVFFDARRSLHSHSCFSPAPISACVILE